MDRLTPCRIAIALSFSFLMGINCANASEEFTPSAWGKGLHLFAGAGPSSSIYESAIDRRDFGVGGHIKADLIYVLNDSWSVDWSSGVDFNKIDDFLSWNTLLSLGVRYRIPYDPVFKTDSSYLKGFIGRAPAVLFIYGDVPSDFPVTKIDRIQFDGHVYGLTLGTFHETSGGIVWYHELTASAQSLESFDAIKMEGEVPVVVSHESFRENGMIYGMFLTFGALIF